MSEKSAPQEQPKPQEQKQEQPQPVIKRKPLIRNPETNGIGGSWMVKV